MNILYLCTFYHRAMIFRDSMESLEKRGHKLLAFNAVAKGSVVDEKYKSIMDDKVVHRECFNKHDRYVYFVKQMKILKHLTKTVDICKYDIIHSHTLFNGGWVAKKIKTRFGIPYVVSVRDTDLNSFLKVPFFKFIARNIVNNSSGIQFLCDSYKEKFIKKCYVNDAYKVLEKCNVIVNGLEAYWMENIWTQRCGVEKNDNIRLLCVGKINANKNMIAVLEAAEILRKKGKKVSVTIIGQVLDEKIFNDLKKYEFVTFLAYMTKEELLKIYRESHVFVLPSIYETFGRVYAEAMTQGLPVIYTKGQGFDGQFIDGHVGYSVSPHDYNGIAESIINIIDNYKQISNNCIAECNKFSWQEIGVDLEKMYEKGIEEQVI